MIQTYFILVIRERERDGRTDGRMDGRTDTDRHENRERERETEREEEYWKIQKSLEFFHFSEHVVKQARKLQKMDFSNLFQLL